MPKRPEKGRQLSCFASNYTVIDLETTGLSSTENEILEIGAVTVRNHTIVDAYSRLVRPERPIDPFITALTGISDSMVRNADRIGIVLPEFLDYVGDDIVLGHNVTFDIAFLYDNCMRLWGRPFSNDYMDTLIIARRKFPEERHNRLSDLEVRFGLKNSRAHRALSDVVLTKQCYDVMRLMEE